MPPLVELFIPLMFLAMLMLIVYSCMQAGKYLGRKWRQHMSPRIQKFPLIEQKARR